MYPGPTSNDVRRARLSDLLSSKPVLRVLEVHNPISAIVAEEARVDCASGAEQFDAFWSSSLTDSTARGLPDIEVLDARSRMANIEDIFAVTTKPLIMDGDTGGRTEHFEYAVRDMERRGISAVVVEDKSGLKQNSLLAGNGHHQLADLAGFCAKIRRGKQAQTTQDFRIFARIEGLILGLGVRDALDRADAYLAAGADGVMIHSRRHSPDEVFEFAQGFRGRHPSVPLICVPTTYHGVYMRELAAAGFNIIIYANHMLRASLKAMRQVSHTIPENGRATEAEPLCLNLDEVLQMGR